MSAGGAAEGGDLPPHQAAHRGDEGATDREREKDLQGGTCRHGFSLTVMAIDFTLPPDVEAIRQRTREFHQMTIAKNVIAAWQEAVSLQSALDDLTL